MQATDPERRAKRDDYSIRSPEPELLFFLSSSIYIIFVGFVASTLEFSCSNLSIWYINTRIRQWLHTRILGLPGVASNVYLHSHLHALLHALQHLPTIL
jgi:hypothetical protein